MSFNLDNAVGILRARGLTVVETEGWNTRGYAGQDLTACAGVLWHHTATSSARNYTVGMPTLNVLVNGHAGLAGPLCNIGLGRDGTVYMVATGVGNHAGTGSAPGIPVNAGNRYLIGIEMESSGVAPWDWTPAMLHAAPILGAALELAYMQHLAPSARMQLGHMEYSDAGKIDPAGWPGGMDGLRHAINNQIAAWSNGQSGNVATESKEDFLMALPDATQNEVVENVRKLVYAQEEQDKVIGGAVTRIVQLSTQLEEVVGNARKAVYGIADVKASIAKLPAVDIAAAIPDDLAQQVVDALAERLGK